MIVLLGAAGLMALSAALLPKIVGDRPLSMPLVLMVVGVVVGLLPLPAPYGEGELDPRGSLTGIETFTELGMLIALAGAGLKASRPLGWRSWSSTWRLLALTLPLSIAATAVLGWWALGLGPAAALLLGAALAPTDPVLAGDVQVPAPHSEDEQGENNEVRFSLTTEAGLNDGLAMPFVLAAVALAGAGFGNPFGWGLTEVVVPLVVGVLIGLLCGRVLAWLMFRVQHERVRLGEYSDGLVVLAIAFLPFALAELVGGLGFVAVFVSAVAVRTSERSHGYHGVLHEFGEQLERLFVSIVLLWLGAALGDGVLQGLRWSEVCVAVLTVLVVRPLFGALALIGAPAGGPATAAIAFFGVRGVGTLYYVAYALSHATFDMPDTLWRTAALAVAVSVVVHGVLSGPVMAWLERRGEHERLGQDEGSA